LTADLGPSAASSFARPSSTTYEVASGGRLALLADNPTSTVNGSSLSEERLKVR